MKIPDEANGLIAAIKNRRSCRRFTGESMSAEIIEMLIGAGEAAPSAHGSRPWKFQVLERKNLLSLTERINGIAAGIKGEKGSAEAKLAILTRHSLRIMEEAATVIAAFNTNELKQSFCGKSDPFLEKYLELMEAQSVAAAMENILLAAHAAGFGGVWLGTPVYFGATIAEALNTSHKPMGFIAIGRPLFAQHQGERGATP